MQLSSISFGTRIITPSRRNSTGRRVNRTGGNSHVVTRCAIGPRDLIPRFRAFITRMTQKGRVVPDTSSLASEAKVSVFQLDPQGKTRHEISLGPKGLSGLLSSFYPNVWFIAGRKGRENRDWLANLSDEVVSQIVDASKDGKVVKIQFEDADTSVSPNQLIFSQMPHKVLLPRNIWKFQNVGENAVQVHETDRSAFTLSSNRASGVRPLSAGSRIILPNVSGGKIELVLPDYKIP